MLLLADMLSTLVQNIILLARGDQTASFIAAFSMFGVIAVLFFGSLAVAHFLYLCFLRRNRINFITSIIQTVGALFYFYGNNINDLINNYGSNVGCTGTCAENSRIISSFALGIALTIINVVPLITKGVLELLKLKQESTSLVVKKIPDWFAAIDMITMFVKINAVYSVVVSMVQSEGFCNTTDIATSTTLLLFCIIVGIFAEVVYFLNARATNKNNSKLYTGLISFTFVSMLFCFPLYLLADNRQPLDCAFGCDTFIFNQPLNIVSSNQTLNVPSCNILGNEAVRVGFAAVSLIFIGTIPIIFFFLNHEAREEVTEVRLALKKKMNEIEMLEFKEAIKGTIHDFGETMKKRRKTLADKAHKMMETKHV